MGNKRKKFEKIYDKYIDQIFRFIYLKTNTKEIAEDLTSETFLKTWEAFQSSEILNPRAFLFKTARNLVIDFYRKKDKENFISIDSTSSVADPKGNIEEKIYENHQVEQIKKAIANLKEEYQTALVLRLVEGISINEIAEILNKTPTSTRVLIHRAILALREECKKIGIISSS